MTDVQLSLHNCLERIARGPSEQLGPHPDGIAFIVLASKLEERGLVRTVKHRNRTRTYTLTTEGKACLAGMRQHKIGDVPLEAVPGGVLWDAGSIIKKFPV